MKRAIAFTLTGLLAACSASGPTPIDGVYTDNLSTYTFHSGTLGIRNPMKTTSTPYSFENGAVHFQGADGELVLKPQLDGSLVGSGIHLYPVKH